MGVNASLMFSRGLPRKVTTNTAATFRPKGQGLSLSPTQTLFRNKINQIHESLNHNLRAGRAGKPNPTSTMPHDSYRSFALRNFMRPAHAASLITKLPRSAGSPGSLQLSQRSIRRSTRIQQKLTSRAPQVSLRQRLLVLIVGQTYVSARNQWSRVRGRKCEPNV